MQQLVQRQISKGFDFQQSALMMAMTYQAVELTPVPAAHHDSDTLGFPLQLH
jgi:hypothetical protein